MHLAIPHLRGLPPALRSEVQGFPDAPGDEYAADTQILCDSNFNVSCETGICYPTAHAASHAEPLRRAYAGFVLMRNFMKARLCVYAGFVEIHTVGCSMVSLVIPSCVWDISIDTMCAEHQSQLELLSGA